MLCETRWSQKYKSIAVFRKNYQAIVEALEDLSRDGNSTTRKAAFQLHSAATKPVFIVALLLIAKYSAFLEPVANKLQSVSIDMLQCTKHIDTILKLVESHRKSARLLR